MEVTINNNPLSLPNDATLADAIAKIGISTSGIAIAINSQVVPADAYAQTQLHNGDKILIIKAFYGG